MLLVVVELVELVELVERAVLLSRAVLGRFQNVKWLLPHVTNLVSSEGFDTSGWNFKP
jgi:hypothetical protein